jgi:GGDEF domain-containing protein
VVTERLRELMAGKSFVFRGAKAELGGSFGRAEWKSGKTADFAALLKAADEALMQERESGAVLRRG